MSADREAAIREALDVLTDVSLGEHRDTALLHESSLNGYAALDALLAELAAAREAIAWACGERGDFHSEYERKLRGLPPYWWRSELRRRAALSEGEG